MIKKIKKNKNKKQNITVSLDAMGGDNSADVVIAGASIVVKKNKNVSFIIYGDEKKVLPLISKYKNLRNKVDFVHTDIAISADEKPSNALRNGRDSSMGLAFKAVKDKKADCAVSAGNTGALMALAMFTLRPLEGVRRPAICASIPTLKSWSAILDLGANVEADVENLVQFGVMGSVFYNIFKKESGKPTVGLLNIGTEATKGKEEIQKAGEILKTSSAMDYKGFVEGNDIGKGITDVVVTDGFTGNVALKTMEGTLRLFAKIMKDTLNKSVFGKLALLVGIPSFLKMKKTFDPSRYNGAILLGLNGIAVKSHGSTNDIGYAAAINVAVELAERKFIDQLKSELEKIDLEKLK